MTLDTLRVLELVLKPSEAERRRPVDTAVDDPPAKDFWDKISAVSGIIATVLIAGLGTLATLVYNGRQLDLQKASGLGETGSPTSV